MFYSKTPRDVMWKRLWDKCHGPTVSWRKEIRENLAKSNCRNVRGAKIQYMGRKVTGMMCWGEMSSEEICGSTDSHVFVTLTRQQEATSYGMEGSRMYLLLLLFCHVPNLHLLLFNSCFMCYQYK
jgi:hypothetical protein